MFELRSGFQLQRPSKDEECSIKTIYITFNQNICMRKINVFNDIVKCVYRCNPCTSVSRGEMDDNSFNEFGIIWAIKNNLTALTFGIFVFFISPMNTSKVTLDGLHRHELHRNFGIRVQWFGISQKVLKEELIVMYIIFPLPFYKMIAYLFPYFEYLYPER